MHPFSVSLDFVSRGAPKGVATTFTLVLALAVASLVSLSAHALPAEASPAEADVLARVGAETVSRGEVEAEVAGELQRLEQERHQLMEAALERLVESRILELEAERRGVGTDELVVAEVAERVAPVTDAEVDAWWEANQQRVRQPKEAVIDQIRAFLGEQRRAERRAELLGELRRRHPVTVLLEPLRLEVDNAGAAGAPVRGPAKAPVTLVAFSDFECPYCGRLLPALDQLEERFGDSLRLVFRQFPLRSIHPNAQKAAEASLCARDQGRFWEMHDALFAQQSQLAVEDLERRAEELGLDTETFSRCLRGGAQAEAVQAEVEAGMSIGVSGTPTLFVNGRPVRLVAGRDTADQVAEVIEDELSRQGAGKARSMR